ncbi:MAG: hypothetical protein ABSA09_03255 [Desulfobaccales bacterium]|jgi:hypothetical protein
MPKKNRAPQEVSKDEVLSRRAAMKRIAAGLAGVGIVAVVGILGQVQAPPCPNPVKWDDNYGNSTR